MAPVPRGRYTPPICGHLAGTRKGLSVEWSQRVEPTSSLVDGGRADRVMTNVFGQGRPAAFQRLQARGLARNKKSRQMSGTKTADRRQSASRRTREWQKGRKTSTKRSSSRRRDQSWRTSQDQGMHHGGGRARPSLAGLLRTTGTSRGPKTRPTKPMARGGGSEPPPHYNNQARLEKLVFRRTGPSLRSSGSGIGAIGKG
jgi:hypothetical protein